MIQLEILRDFMRFLLHTEKVTRFCRFNYNKNTKCQKNKYYAHKNT